MTEHGEQVVHPEDVEHPPSPRKDRVAAWVADRCATVEFGLLNVALVVAWGLLKIEKFPFAFLTLVLSVEAILLTVAVLIGQKAEVEQQRVETQADAKNDALAAEHILAQTERLEDLHSMLTKLLDKR